MNRPIDQTIVGEVATNPHVEKRIQEIAREEVKKMIAIGDGRIREIVREEAANLIGDYVKGHADGRTDEILHRMAVGAQGRGSAAPQKHEAKA